MSDLFTFAVMFHKMSTPEMNTDYIPFLHPLYNCLFIKNDLVCVSDGSRMMNKKGRFPRL